MASELLRSVFTAYLQPLLDKHEKNQILVYEDLASSLQAAEAVLDQNISAEDHAIVKQKLVALHKEQMTAYQQAAKQSLQEHARTVELVPWNKNTTVPTAHLQECLKRAIEQAPKWVVPRTSQLSLLSKIITERAKEAQQQQLSESNEEEEGEEMDDDGAEGTEDDDEEEGDEDDDNDEDDDEEEADDEEEEGEVAVSAEDATEEATNNNNNKTKKKVGKKRPSASNKAKGPPRKKAKGLKAARGGGNRRTARRGRGGGQNTK